MRHDKEFTIITREKIEEPTMQYHCAQHPGCRMIRLPTGLRCESCGSPFVATRIIDTTNPLMTSLDSRPNKRSE